MNLIITWLVSALAIIVCAYILPGASVDTFVTALILALVLGIINVIIKPILLFLTLPINVLTLGLFTFVINALMIMLADYLVPGFSVANFWWALLFAIVLSLVNGVFHSMKRQTLQTA